MARPPYMNFPFPFYKNYYKPSHSPYIYPVTPTNATYQNNSYPYPPQQITNNNMITNCENVNGNHFDEKNKSNKYNDDYLFDLFGLKIYNDDILLVSLIYFLYSEGVKDDGLFLVLILLLLS